jgi:ketosteroid isomerase-like protein
MRTHLFFLAYLFLLNGCQRPVDKEAIKSEILQTEKAFEKMAADKGITEAFYRFAADSAVILRENDTLITGKENIRHYYEWKNAVGATVNWTPDFIGVSDCGTLAYTYGKYVWKIRNHLGEPVEYRGVFHTVWQKQRDGTWKYTWD